MKKLLKSISLILTLTLSLSTASFAHSGRTDSNGGHKDNKNKSGLGYYHYHCGGYPAHLHTNGVCPYSSYSSSSSSESTYTASVSNIAARKPTVKLSTVRTFINGFEIPAFEYNGTIGVVAEDLSVYGFDVTWNGSLHTLTVTDNPVKAITPIPMNYYRNIGSGAVFCEASESTVNVSLVPGNSYASAPSLKCSANGYTFIPIDDLSRFGTYIWNENTRTIDLILPRN